MANNTIMTAKNTFGDGLVMDLAPDITQATCLTNALNATLLTFNGNEMSLQNDMGNGRVETARLPEGYIPMGSCEFGGIIYIVSYNPIENKSQIGCFPSPERNLTSEELGLPNVSLSTLEFLEIDNTTHLLTGKLKTSSVKKVLYSKKLNSGDKYIIYSLNIKNEQHCLELNQTCLSEYGNKSHSLDEKNRLPKFLKLHVVAIEDSGKINYLDTTVKWYDDYYIMKNRSKNSTELNQDIDGYRALAESPFSIFQSKISGKLAIFAELERINGFNASYIVEECTDLNSENKKYNVYYYISWDTSNYNVNPSHVLLTEFSKNWESNNKYNYYKANGEFYYSNITRLYKPEKNLISSDYNYYNLEETYKNNYDGVYKLLEAEGKDNNDFQNYYLNPVTLKNNIYYNDKGEECNIKAISDDVINNYFKRSVKKLLTEVTIPQKQENNDEHRIFLYKIAPAMPYGILEELSREGKIDFDLIGSNDVSLTEWRYYNDGLVSTLKWGLEAYPGKFVKVRKVEFLFYDNNGLAAKLENKDLESFSGNFTEHINFGPNTYNAKLGHFDETGQVIRHIGGMPMKIDPNELSTDDINDLKDCVKNDIYIAMNGDDMLENIDNINTEDIENIIFFTNDAGTLYPNILYLVKIKVTLSNVDELGNIISDIEDINKEREFYRWYFTNSLMNEYYFNNIDYNEIKNHLDINLDPHFISNNNFEILSPDNPKNETDLLDLNPYIKNADPNNKTADYIAENTVGKSILRIKSNNSNLNLYLCPKLEESYNSFYIDMKGIADTLNVIVKTGQSEIDTSLFDKADLIYSGDEVNTAKKYLRSKVKKDKNDGYTSDNDHDYFSLSIDKWNAGSTANTGQYINNKGETVDYPKNSRKKTYGFYWPKSDIELDSDIENSLIQEEENVLGVAKIPLYLDGLMISKICNSAINENPVYGLVYKPAIGSVDDLDKYGIEIMNNKFLFKTPAFMSGLGDKLNGKDDERARLVIGLCNNSISGDIEFPSKSECIELNKHRQIDFKSAVNESGLDFGLFSILIYSIFNNSNISSNNDGDTRLLDINNYSNNSVDSNWQSFWKTGDYKDRIAAADKDNKFNVPVYGGIYLVENNAANRRVAFSIISKDVNGNYILFNDFGTPVNVSPKNIISQRLKVSNGNETFALYIASLLSKIYYKSTEERQLDNSYITYTDIIKVSPYSESWNLDFVIKLDKKNNNIEDWNIISLSNINYKEYLNAIKSKVSDNELNNIKMNNVEFKLNFDIDFLITFNYSLNYDVKLLEKKYNNYASKVYIIDPLLTDNINQPIITNNIPFEGSLAIETGHYTDKHIYEFDKLNKINVINKLAINLSGEFEYKNETLDFNPLFINNLVLKDNMVSFNSFGSINRTGLIKYSNGNEGNTNDNGGYFSLNFYKNCYILNDITETINNTDTLVLTYKILQ